MSSIQTSSSCEYIFFGTRAYFSSHVLDCLYQADLRPAKIIIPEYSGNRNLLKDKLAVEQSYSIHQLEKLADLHDTPCIYAPHEYSDDLIDNLSEITFDYILVACWPYLLSREIYQLASKAALNLHPSLLPRYRGANPVQDQVDKRERYLGVSLHLINDIFDTGDIVKQIGFNLDHLQYECHLIEKKAAELGAGLFIEAVKQYDVFGWHITAQ